ncbi:MAG TPA: SRPBCC family protein, partial [Mycobacterium sp.]|nr:SRPBCC family protein [Mycobacterium sp.]
MSESGPASVQAEVTIDADADTVYSLITDLPTLGSLAEEA